jgi:hypothetical protein
MLIEKLTNKEIKQIRKENSKLIFLNEKDINIEKYFGLIYIIILPTGMIYVGYTQNVPGTKEYNRYFGSGCCKEFKDAKKLHKEELRREVLDVVYKDVMTTDNHLMDLLINIEIHYQRKTNCRYPEIGYNILEGSNNRCSGDLHPMKHPTVRKRMSDLNKGKICITNDIINKRINKDEKIPEGFWLGMSNSMKEKCRINVEKGIIGTKGKLMITNGVDIKFIKEDEEIPANWERGSSEHMRKRVSESTSGENHHLFGKHLPEYQKELISISKLGDKNWCFGLNFKKITNGIDERMILSTDALPENWWYGRSQNNLDKYPNKIGKNNSMYGRTGELAPGYGMYWANDGNKNIRIKNGEPLQEGFTKGKKNKTGSHLGKTWYHNKHGNKYFIEGVDKIPKDFVKGLKIKKKHKLLK